MAPLLPEIDFDAEAALARHSRVVLDPNYLAALHGGLSRVLNAEQTADETRRSAPGPDACEFVAREAAQWSSHGDRRAARSLAALPFARMRALVRDRCPRGPERALPEETATTGSMDRDAAAVQ